MDVLEIVFEKGGTSVLADAWLAAGTLAPIAGEFAFAWGVAQQLGDDFQDVAADIRNGIRTAFSEAVEREPLDAVTNRAFHFSARVLADLDGVGAAAPPAIRELIRTSFFMPHAGRGRSAEFLLGRLRPRIGTPLAVHLRVSAEPPAPFHAQARDSGAPGGGLLGMVRVARGDLVPLPFRSNAV